MRASYLFIKVTVAQMLALTLAALVMWVILRVKGLSMPRERRMWSIFAVMAVINAALFL